jgi:hypothetical protein
VLHLSPVVYLRCRPELTTEFVFSQEPPLDQTVTIGAVDCVPLFFGREGGQFCTVNITIGDEDFGRTHVQEKQLIHHLNNLNSPLLVFLVSYSRETGEGERRTAALQSGESPK